MSNMWWLSIPIIITLFILLRKLNSRIQSPLLKAISNPVFLAITIFAVILIAADLSYTRFYQHSQLLSWLLEPAIVALALPLYQQFIHIRKNALLILLSCTFGVINATVVATLLSALFDVPVHLAASVAALSVTTPITLLITDSLGGIASLAAAMVIFIGLLGALFGFMLFRILGIYNHQAQGVAIGTACHAIGTAAALNENTSIGAFASVAMALSALVTALIVPLLYPFLSQALL
ncbi:LrgB family protein [Pseudoalteromonas sp. NEC-BIFX-2020_002]|uniref:LrgB family protein n=1 Tax=unclassified Pseudoalteromonas TaxID=194690 RepID=UPI00146155C7|nr:MULTISPECIES: LrgB family protein [unclassified Pseudoalteromonas]NMR26696.1 LrgB family protein [Pseudoalteromonas sp. NEC-BIFX-2020_015]NNG44671.1 LrgB family protein [Pseudoalteromonas sp. NEC-BIFX-2020_002]